MSENSKIKIGLSCIQCTDTDGDCVFPYFGLGPHNNVRTRDTLFGPGFTEQQQKNNYPENFIPDEESNPNDDMPDCGIYTHCLECHGAQYVL